MVQICISKILPLVGMGEKAGNSEVGLYTGGDTECVLLVGSTRGLNSRAQLTGSTI